MAETPGACSWPCEVTPSGVSWRTLVPQDGRRWVCAGLRLCGSFGHTTAVVVQGTKDAACCTRCWLTGVFACLDCVSVVSAVTVCGIVSSKVPVSGVASRAAGHPSPRDTYRALSRVGRPHSGVHVGCPCLVIFHRALSVCGCGGGVQTQAPHSWKLSTPLVIACFFLFL